MSPYEVLGVEPDCSDEEIKMAYRGKASRSHPDGGNEDGWHEVREAYELLSNPVARRAHDEGEEDDPTDHAAELVAQTFDGVMSGGIQRDLVSAVGYELRKMLGNTKIRLKEMRNDLDKKDALLGRIDFFGGTSAEGGIINDVIRQQIADGELAILTTEKSLKHIEDAIEIASKFEDKWEPEEPEDIDYSQLDQISAQFA